MLKTLIDLIFFWEDRKEYYKNIILDLDKTPYLLRLLPFYLKNDREIVLKAIQKDGLLIRFASKKLKNDKEIVLEAVKQNGLALKFVSRKLRNNKDIVLDAIEQNGSALKFASKKLRKIYTTTLTDFEDMYKAIYDCYNFNENNSFWYKLAKSSKAKSN